MKPMGSNFVNLEIGQINSNVATKIFGFFKFQFYGERLAEFSARGSKEVNV